MGIAFELINDLYINVFESNSNYISSSYQRLRNWEEKYETPSTKMGPGFKSIKDLECEALRRRSFCKNELE